MSTPSNIVKILQEAVAHHQNGRLDKAENLYTKVLKVDARNANALNLMGVIAQSRGEVAHAKSFYERAIKGDPAEPDYRFNLGNLLLSANQTDAALAAYAHALKLAPHHAATLLNMGVTLDRVGRTDKAVDCFRRLIVLTPKDARVPYNLGQSLARLAQNSEAEASFKRALDLNPGYLDAHVSLAALYTRGNHVAEAIHHTREAIGLRPDPKYHSNLGELYRRAGDLDAALAAHRAALAIMPHDAGILHNYGAALHAAGRLNKARDIFQRAIASNPQLIEAYEALAKVYEHQALFDDAIATLLQALVLEPQSSNLLFKLSIVQLGSGNLKDGWRNYDHRLHKMDDACRRATPPAYWRGEDLTAKNIVVWTEQGVGDEIMYASIIPDIVALAGHCTVECSVRMAPIFARSFPRAGVVPFMVPGQPATPAAGVDYQISAASLGQFLRPTIGSFPRHHGYLEADPARTALLRACYTARAPGNLIVGVAWRSTRAENGANKSADIALWTEILNVPGITFVNLQYGDCSEELAAVKRETGIEIFQDPEVDALRNMDDFCAQVAAMDLVISTSNTAVHVAGSLNVPTWLMLSGEPTGLWYWMQNRTDSPWYPSVRIFRAARAPGNAPRPWWKEVISDVAHNCRHQAKP